MKDPDKMSDRELRNEVRELRQECKAEVEVRNAVANHSIRQDQEIERLTAEIDRRGRQLSILTEACKRWLDSPNNQQCMATVREMCKAKHEGTHMEMAIDPDWLRKKIAASSDDESIETSTWDCGCPDGAEDKCVSITCPRR